MKTTSFTLLPDSNDEINMVSEPFHCAGFYRSNDVFNTVTIHSDKFLGKLYFEGSLAQYPEEKDWFPLFELEYDGSEPNKSEYHNIVNNMVNIRVKLDRSYIENLDTTKMGKINKIYLSY